MNSNRSLVRQFLFLTAFAISSNAFSQVEKIASASFPDSWDTNKNLRGKNGKVLLWKHVRNDRKNEWRNCIVLVIHSDSSGNNNYSISEMYTNKKPFKKWHFAWTQYFPNSSDTPQKSIEGIFNTHLTTFTHKPTERELFDLFSKWDYSLIEKFSTTLEAGIDESLWLETFGFPPDKRKLVQQ